MRGENKMEFLTLAKMKKKYLYEKKDKNNFIFDISLFIEKYQNTIDEYTMGIIENKIKNDIGIVNQFVGFDFDDIERYHIYVYRNTVSYKVYDENERLKYVFCTITGFTYSKHAPNSYHDEPIDFGIVGDYRKDIFSRIYDVKIK